MINASCPISQDLVNAKLTRVYSFLTLLTIIIYAYTPYKEVIYISTLDFFIRIFLGVKYSPICYIIRYVLNVGNFSVNMVNAGPKKFAAKIGLFVTFSLSISYLFDFTSTSIIIAHISILAVGAEAIFGYCIACKIYSSIIPRIKYFLNK